MLKACLNGNRPPGSHPRLPVTPDEIAADTAACAAMGAAAVHAHPRDAVGAESLAAQDVGQAVSAIRLAAPSLGIGVTTGAWICPDPAARLALVAGWARLPDRPDFASVNVYEEGWREVAETLLAAGIGIEPGLETLDDLPRLLASGLLGEATRVLVEPYEPDVAGQLATAARLAESLVPVLGTVPLLAHGAGHGAWPVLRWAFAHGYDSRIGLEDTFAMDDGAPAAGNAELVANAMSPRRG